MNNIYKWLIKKYFSTVKVRDDEVLIVAVRDKISRRELETLAKDAIDILGENVVFIGDVSKVVVIN